MFSLFKKKSPKELLEKKYKALLEESFHLSKIDRKASDLKAAEAAKILVEIDKLV